MMGRRRTGGPRTAEGKAVARLNATKHGIRSSVPVLPFVERQTEWERHAQATVESLAPVGHLELLLAQRAAHLFWRLHRVARYENEVLTTQQETVEEQVRTDRLAGSISAAHPEDVRYHLSWRQNAYEVVRQFPRQPEDRPLSGSDAADVLNAVAGSYAVRDCLEGRSLSYSCLPEEWDPDDWAECEGWTVALVHRCLRQAAEQTGLTVEELLEGAEERARLDVVEARYEWERCESQVLHARREALMLPARALETVSRYEAHLNRQLTSALHELEARQARRQGQPSPLARLDVSDLST